MEIVFNKSYGERFAKYLIMYVYCLADSIIDLKRCDNIDNEFNINSKQIILTAIKNLSIDSTNRQLIIRINKNLKFNHMNIGKLINQITYGNRSVKGYHIIEDLFKYIQNDIENIYERWLANGN